MENINLYLKQLIHLNQLIKIQITIIKTKSLRSQQYQNNMAININHQSKIIKNIQNLRLKKNNLYNTIRLAKENYNILQINHSKYIKLAANVCYTNSCSVYYQYKNNAEHWPKTQTPIY